jgi:ADP-dependent NAD(P)H-hydrate dehydratase / NAD(P)H-hydrate epimerase
MDPNGGQFEKAVYADVTTTFYLPKPGLIDVDNQEFVGEIAVADIGIPPEAETVVGVGDVKLVSGRGHDSHKGDGGRVLVIGGGAYSGAPALAAMAALRTGADIVTVAAPKSVSKIIASFSPNLIVRKLSEKRLHQKDIPVLEELIKAHDVVVIGMGLGRDDKTAAAVRDILPLCDKVVVDADALAALEKPLDQYGCDMIITPHAGEFKNLSGEDIPDDRDARIGLVNRFSRENSVVTLMKSPEDIISDGQANRVNLTGNPGMTVGGTGDVLAGITGALFAGYTGIEAAAASAYICGRSGDIVYDELGLGLTATDVIDYIPAAMKI